MPPSAVKPNSISVIALVGFMGAGKTTVGEALAARLASRFFDLDQVIEAERGRTIAQIFEQDGETRFREIERETLAFLLQETGERAVLALGGGAYAKPAIRQVLESHDVSTVWLKASADELYHRCEQPGIVRPLRKTFEDFRKLYESRMAAYGEAEYCVETDGKTSEAVVEEIVATLALAPFPGERSEKRF